MEYKCHLLFPENPPPIIVRRWYNKVRYTDYLFVGERHPNNVRSAFTEIKEGKAHASPLIRGIVGDELYEHILSSNNIEIIYHSLFKDDTVQRSLLKIMSILGIKNERFFPYSWSEKGPLRFKFLENTPIEYDLNPYYSYMTTPPYPNVQQMSDKVVIYKMLEFTTYSSFIKEFESKSINFKAYYFPNDKDKVYERDIVFASQDNIVLTDLWSNSSLSMHEVLIRDSMCNYVRAYFEDRLEIPLSNYKHVFNNLDTDTIVPFIQLCDDLNNIYYKVSHNHKIPNQLFDEWTDISQIQTKHSLVMYSFINGTSSYMKTVFSQGTDIHIVYRNSSVDIIDYSDINKHLVQLQKKLGTVDVNMSPEIDRLAVKTSITVSKVDLKGIARVLMKYPTIFKFDGTKNTITDKILNFMYIRVEKFGEPTDILDYIRDRLGVQVSLDDVIAELNEYGIDRNEVIEYVNQIKDEDADIIKKVPKAKKSFKNKGLLITITKKPHELGITINNASSFTEIQNALFWIRCGVINWSKAKKEKAPEPKKKAVTKKVPEEEEEEEEEEEKSFTEKSLSSLESNMSGGAGDTENQRYLINQLEAHDPTLFKNSTYSKSCSANAKRQPVVMSLKNKERIDKEGYSDGYDNYIVYGSDPSQQNVYMCPRVYCPQSRVPISAEKYKAGVKCPKEGENPMLLYNGITWDNNIDKPHYIGFLKTKGGNDMYLPCCFGLKQTGLEAKLKGEVRNPPPEGGYIIDKMAALPVGRFGSIPNTLHDIIHKDIPYKQCKGTVKSTECVLRRGIERSPDSLMESITYLLNYETKQSLCDAIKKHLDPFTFITLENGDVYTYFIPSKPIFPEKNLDKRLELKKWLKVNKAYTKLYDLGDIIEYLDKPSLRDAPPSILYKVAKQLIIHTSFNRFLEYLNSSENTSPYMLFDLIYHMGALLIVWDREDENIVTARSPYSPKNKMWYNGYRNIPYIMVMQHETHYEPLVLVDQYKNVTQKVPFVHFDRLTQLISVFPVMMRNEDMQIQDLYGLARWIERLFSQPSGFKLDRLLIDPNDRAIGCFLVNNLYISFKHPLSVFSLKNTVELCNINKLIYWEDVGGKDYSIVCNVYDLKLLETKLLKLDLVLKKGHGIDTDGRILKSTYTVPRVIYKEPPKTPRIIKDVFVRKTETLNDNELWYSVKKSILTKLVEEYDIIVKPHLKLSRDSLLQKVYTDFKYIDEPSHTAVILEELPLNDKQLLKNNLDELLTEKPYYYKDTIVHDDKKNKQWIFSQKAIAQNLIEDIKYPTTIHRPKNYPREENETVIDKQLAEPLKVPDMLNPSKLVRSNIPSKWRSKKFKEYEIGTLTDYSRDSLIKLFQWIAYQKDIRFDVNDINIYLRAQISTMLGDKNMYETVLEDPYLREEWTKYYKGRTINEIIKNGFDKTTTTRLREVWNEISKKTTERMFQDMDLYNVSELLQVNFLILQKGKDVRKGGGNLEELVGSSKFISNLAKSEWPNLPLFILFKDTYKEKPRSYFVYSILLKNKEPSYFKFGYLVPDDIRNVIEVHIKRLKEKM